MDVLDYESFVHVSLTPVQFLEGPLMIFVLRQVGK